MARILSLDGGGSWALIQVRALMALYRQPGTTGHDVLSEFDIVASNSGGSLVLAGLVENLPLATLLSYFEDEAKRRSIFSPTKSCIYPVLHKLAGVGPIYNANAKLSALQALLPQAGNVPLSVTGNSIRGHGKIKPDVHLLIMGFDYDRNRATFFRSAATTDAAWGIGESTDITLAEAVHASANPPVNFFDGPAVFPGKPGQRYWDGGVSGCNNPVLAAVTEAIQLGCAPTDVAALSIGTASVALPWPKPTDPPSELLSQPSRLGLKNDLAKLATSILDDPPDIATFLAYVITGGDKGLTAPLTSRIVRMNPLISPVQAADGGWIPPGTMTVDAFVNLKNLDMDAVEQSQVDEISMYAQLWLDDQAPNQPIRMNGDTLEPELGDVSFSQAAARWDAVKPYF